MSPHQAYKLIISLIISSTHRGLAAGIYTTNGPDACHYVANDCKANIIVVENQKQLDKILEVYMHFIQDVGGRLGWE